MSIEMSGGGGGAKPTAEIHLGLDGSGAKTSATESGVRPPEKPKSRRVCGGTKKSARETELNLPTATRKHMFVLSSLLPFYFFFFLRKQLEESSERGQKRRTNKKKKSPEFISSAVVSSLNASAADLLEPE